MNIRRNLERVTGAIDRLRDRFRKQKAARDRLRHEAEDAKAHPGIRLDSRTHGSGRGNGVRHVHVKRTPKTFGRDKGGSGL